MHVALLLSIPALGFLRPQTDIWAIAWLAAAVAFFSASLDIAMDAFRRELLPDAELGLGNSIYVNAYRISSLVPGSLALILADRHALVVGVRHHRAVHAARTRDDAAWCASRCRRRRAEDARARPSSSPSASSSTAPVGRRRCWWWPSSFSTSSATAWRRRSPRRSTSTSGSPRPRSVSSPRTRDCGRASSAACWAACGWSRSASTRACGCSAVVQLVSILGFAWLAWLGQARCRGVRAS